MLEFFLGKIVEWFKEEVKGGSWKGYKTFFSPVLGIVGWFFLQRLLELTESCFNEHIHPCASAISLLILFLLSIIASNLLVYTLLSIPLLNKLFIKYSSYEKREDDYYLKGRNLLKRDYFNFINRYAEILLLMLGDLLGRWIAGEIESTKLTLIGSIIEPVTIWCALRSAYFDGKTWDEKQEAVQIDLDNRTSAEENIWKSVSEKMENALGCFLEYTSSSYTESDEKKVFSGKYREMFLKLKNDKSVYITNCFYQDWERAIFIPIHRFLLNDRKVIILAGRSMSEVALVEWINRELENMIGSPDSWYVKVWERGSRKWDIGVVRYKDIPYFAREFGRYESIQGVFVLVMEPSCMLLELRPYLEVMADRLKNMEKEPVYCLADREMTGLLDTFSHVFRTMVEGISIDFSKCANIRYYGIDNMVKMEAKRYWKVLDYWSNGSVIASELLKKGESIIYCPGSVSAVMDIRDSLRGKILTPVFSLQEQKYIIEKYNKSSFISSFWEIKKQESSHIIAEDNNRNFYEICNLMAGRGRGWEDIFVVSEEYVLRAYMWERASRQMFVKDAVPVYFPIYENTERNKVLKLLYRGYDGEIPLEFVMDFLGESCTGNVLKKKINDKISKYFSLDENTEAVTVKNDRSMVLNEKFIRDNQWWMEDVYFVDEENRDKEYGCRKMGQLSQFFMTGQYIVLDGRYYMIQGFEKSFDRNLMLLRRSSSLNHQGSDYCQKRIYEITDIRSYEENFIDSHVEIKVLTGDITVETERLVETRSWDWFSPEQEKNVEEEILGSKRFPRHYKNKKLLNLYLCKDVHLSKEKKLNAYNGLAVLLTEFSKTIFPYHYPYLAILPVNQSETETVKRYLYQLKDVQKYKDVCEEGILILEDSVEDIGILETIIRHFSRIMSLCYDYCKWAREKDIHYMGSNSWPDMIKQVLPIWEVQSNEKNSNNKGAGESTVTAIETEAKEAEEESEEESESGADKSAGETSAALDWRDPKKKTAKKKTEKTSDDQDVYGNAYGKWYCTACGAELPERRIIAKYKYCEDCVERENRIQDYKNSFDRVRKWLEEHMGIYIGWTPQITIRWLGGKSKRGIRRPIALIGKKRISCREGMKEECIDLHMIRVCIELWMRRNEKKMKKRKGKKLKGYRKMVPFWFQVQYLYLVQSKEDAVNFERKVGVAEKKMWKKLKEKYPFVEVRNLCKTDVKKLYENNPITGFGKQSE